MKRIIERAAVGAALILLLLSMLGAARTSMTTARSSSQTGVVDAAALFAKNCAKCHGRDGRAKTFRGKIVGARDFTNAEWQSRVSDETLAASITNGRGSMPSFKKKLSDEEIKSLVNYVRKFKKT